MKRKVAGLLCVILIGTGLWRSGQLVHWLQILGQHGAMMAVGRSFSVGESIRLETGQGFEEGLFIAPAVSKKDTASSAAPVVNLSINNGKYAVTQNIALKNATKQSIDISAALQKGFTPPTFKEGQPAVLIYHTHTTESYADASSGYSLEFDKGVVGVGEEMKRVFESHGLKTIHLTENYIDGGAFKQAYTRSLKGVEQTLKKYPSIQIVLDIHRDSITEGNTEYCPLTVLEGKEYAQIMVITGSDTLGLSHPNWQQNMRYAMALVARLQKDYPGISRPLNVNANRYNTHTTPYALLVEVGGGANTSEQAKRSGAAVAESICNIVIH